jgi:hypothetical protein
VCYLQQFLGRIRLIVSIFMFMRLIHENIEFFC